MGVRENVQVLPLSKSITTFLGYTGSRPRQYDLGGRPGTVTTGNHAPCLVSRKEMESYKP